MQRTCCFCDNTPLTLEHVYPDWLSGYFKKGAVVINEVIEDGVSRTWNKAIFQHKAKIVCASCNNGWMSSLETEVKPILEKLVFTDEKAEIDESQQAILSYWVQKTILILNKSTGGKFKIPVNIYKDLFAHQKPLKSIAVNVGWRIKAKGIKDEPLATFEIVQIGNMQVHKNDEQSVRNDLETGKLAWSATLGLGKIVFHAFGHNLNASLELIGNDDRVMFPINPFEKNLSWPLEWPVEALGGLEELRKSTSQ